MQHNSFKGHEHLEEKQSAHQTETLKEWSPMQSLTLLGPYFSTKQPEKLLPVTFARPEQGEWSGNKEREHLRIALRKSPDSKMPCRTVSRQKLRRYVKLNSENTGKKCITKESCRAPWERDWMISYASSDLWLAYAFNLSVHASCLPFGGLWLTISYCWQADNFKTANLFCRNGCLDWMPTSRHQKGTDGERERNNAASLTHWLLSHSNTVILEPKQQHHKLALKISGQLGLVLVDLAFTQNKIFCWPTSSSFLTSFFLCSFGPQRREFNRSINYFLTRFSCRSFWSASLHANAKSAYDKMFQSGCWATGLNAWETGNLRLHSEDKKCEMATSISSWSK